MRLTKQELPSAPYARSAPRLDEAETFSEIDPASFKGVIEFFETADQFPEALNESAEESQINQEAGKAFARRLPAVRGANRFEESLYWLLGAVALFYLLLAFVSR
jgi:hypothetical protein